MKFPHHLPSAFTAGLTWLLLSAPLALADQELRVMTWNMQTVDAPGSASYQAAAAVLGRIDAEVVAIQEVASAADDGYLRTLANQLGYPYVAIAPAGPFGALRNALLSDFPITQSTFWSADLLSGDGQANDLTRYLLEAEIDTGQADFMHLVVTHQKSGTTNEDEYRRAIESRRLAQVVSKLAAGAPFVLMGDFNADIQDAPQAPALFTSPPDGLPVGFVTGSDIVSLMASGGLPNESFQALTNLAVMLDAKQLDGDYATRIISGRRLDYLFASTSIYRQGQQVYDCADEYLPGGLPLSGNPLPIEACLLASDHLPVFADLVIPTGPDEPFADVPPTSWAYGYINAIRNADITGGCGNGNYCPQGLVTREQMAAFLVRAVEGEPAADYCGGSSYFGDVAPDAWSCRYIKRLAELNITGGCGGGNYCPQGLVTRDQMAAFIVRAVAGEPALDYCGGVAPFQDVAPSTLFCRYIKRLVELGVTQGCGNNNYCPSNEVTREQMAAFLARAFLGMD